MATAPSTKRFQSQAFPAEQRPLVEALNDVLTSAALAIGTLPAVVIRRFDVTMPDDWTTPALSGLWLAQSPVGYRKRPDGSIEFRGVLTGGAHGTTAIFTLPTALRPASLTLLPVAQSSASAPAGLLQVFATGEVVAPVVGSIQSGTSAYFSLDGVQFAAADLATPTLARPIQLAAGGLPSVNGLLALSCLDVTTTTPVAAPIPSVSWSANAPNGVPGVQINALPGLAGGRTYTLTVALVAGVV
jgi:hypothetical protein